MLEVPLVRPPPRVGRRQEAVKPAWKVVHRAREACHSVLHGLVLRIGRLRIDYLPGCWVNFAVVNWGHSNDTVPLALDFPQLQRLLAGRDLLDVALKLAPLLLATEPGPLEYPQNALDFERRAALAAGRDENGLRRAANVDVGLADEVVERQNWVGSLKLLRPLVELDIAEVVHDDVHRN